MTFTPLRNYANFEHVLNAAPTCMHPNGTLYGCAIEKRGSIQQDLTIYRKRPGSAEHTEVWRFQGGVDAESQFAMGGCMLLPDGSLEVWASLDPKGSDVTKTGFEGMWTILPGIDEPFTLGSGPAGPQGPPGAPGAGGITLLPTPAIVTGWEGHTLAGAEWVDIPRVFGVPAASGYLIRFVAKAAAANVRVRAGTPEYPFWVSVNTQVPNIEIHAQGWAPGPSVYVSAVNGTPQVWLQVLGLQGQHQAPLVFLPAI